MKTQVETKVETETEIVIEGVETNETPENETAKDETNLENGNGNGGEGGEGDEPEDESFTVDLTSATPAEDFEFDEETASPTLKHIRDKYKAETKKRRDAEKRIEELEAKTEKAKAPELRARPTLDAHDYDDEAFAEDLEKWIGEKKIQDKHLNEQKQKQQSAQQSYDERQTAYMERKAELNIPDYDDGEATVRAALTDHQRMLLVNTADDPALVVLALSQNPAKLKALASEADNGRFANKLGKLEANMKKGRKTKPSPESNIQGSGAASYGGTDKELERLEKEADRTGDRTKIRAYYARKREQ